MRKSGKNTACAPVVRVVYSCLLDYFHHMTLYYCYRQSTQRLVLAAAAGQASHLRLPKPLLACGAYLQAAKPLSAANGVGRWMNARLAGI